MSGDTVAAPICTDSEAVDALRRLERAATIVARYGARTGSQWSALSSALILARAAIQNATPDATSARETGK